MTDNDLIIPSCLFALKERKKIPLKSDWPKIIRIPEMKQCHNVPKSAGSADLTLRRLTHRLEMR